MNTTIAARPVLALALQNVRSFETHRDQWLADTAESARCGYGPSHCIHGASLWVDHDVICVGCEGDTINQHSPRGEILAWALAEAHARIATERERRAQDRRLHHGLIFFCLDRLRTFADIPEDERDSDHEQKVSRIWQVVTDQRARY